MNWQLRDEAPAPEAFKALYDSTGWGSGERPVADFARALAGSWACAAVYAGERLVGFGRVISDGCLHAYVNEMIVHPDWQSCGIGQALLQRLLARCEAAGIRDIQLFAARGKQAFYERQGFVARPVDAPGMQFQFLGSAGAAETEAASSQAEPLSLDGLTRRAAGAQDLAFLSLLRELTMRPHELASGLVRNAAESLARVHKGFEFAEILEFRAEPIGLLKLDRRGSEWELIQIQLRPEFQGRGLGTQLLAELVGQARQAGASLRLGVLKANPARALYERHGFVVERQTEHGFEMRLEPLRP